MQLSNAIKVKYQYSDELSTITKWLEELKQYPIIACDFEAAKRYSDEELEEIKKVSEDTSRSHIERKTAESVLLATPLDHPSHVRITHLSIAWSDSEAYVIIFDSQEVEDAVLEFLVTTDITQIWHRASYDFRLIYHLTGKMPKNYEDTQIYTKTLFNHVETHQAKSGLKELAGEAYGDWGIDTTLFTLAEQYSEKMLLYAATDACATFWVWKQITTNVDDADINWRLTSEEYTPWSQLPDKVPSLDPYSESYFYHNTAKWLIRDTVRIMMNGLPIDLQKVEALEGSLTDVLTEVEESIAANPLVSEFLDMKYEEQVQAYIKQQKSKLKTSWDYVTEFNPKNPVHRSYFMQVLNKTLKITPPTETLDSGVPKWAHKTLKKLSTQYPVIRRLVEGKVNPESSTVKEAMKLFAEHKAENYNKRYLEKIKNPDLAPLKFNPNSSKQKQEFFAYVGLQSDKVSATTGAPSWDREQIERINKETADEDVKNFTQSLIDFSFASIIQTTFVPAFYRYTVDGNLHGQYNLLGAKSGRYTSSNPNMLNTPSTRSRFAQSVKECFVAPEGFIVGAIDYSGLEDRVIANLSGDENKLAIFLEDIDGHSLGGAYYFKEEVSDLLQQSYPPKEAAVKLYEEVDNGNKAAKSIRDRSKPINFGLAYGAYPPKIAQSLQCSLKEAEGHFNAYHYELYPGITEYRENYVLPTVEEKGYIHTGLGFRLYSDSPAKDIRSLNNATCQFWSILTALTINRLHYLIDEAGLTEDILITSTIYDSVYFIIKDDPEVVAWLNERVIPIMEKPFIEGQIVQNSVDLEIGSNWYDLHKLSHNASLEEIEEVRAKW